ncbi:MAG: phenylalanine--tRNA ligase subunit beta, partial [Clostridia bacterium]
MKVTLSWLKDFVNINVPIDVLCAKMVAIGLEIEEVEYLGDKVTNVVVGQITALHKHENADKLQVCQVDIGEGKIVQIVTAATNIFIGAKVPVSLDGANLATGQHITSGMLRGVLSEGMFCSGEELGITNDYIDGAEVNGILILDKKSKLGCDIRKVVGLDDYLLDVN